MRIKSIMVRLFGVVAVSAVGLIALAAICASSLRQELVSDSIAKTRSLVGVALSIAQSFDDRAKKGEFDQATAQARAKEAIRALKYDGNEYFFAYTYDGTNVIHGADQTREGKNFLDTKDPTGYAYIVDMMKIGQQEGGGHIFYTFRHPNSTAPAPKVSSVLPFKPWGWIIGTGTYIDNIDARFWRAVVRLAVGGAIILVVALLAAYLLSRTIANPVRALAGVTTLLGKGDYSQSVPAVNRADEVGALARAILVLRDQAKAAEELRAVHEATKAEMERERHASLIALADNFETSVKGVVEAIVVAVAENDNAAQTMTGVSEEASADATNVAHAADAVSTGIQTVAAATEQLSASIGEISTQVHNSTRIARQAVEDATETDRLVNGLSVAVDRIDAVAKLIGDIAANTNLLALNATIEAARAGEVGKGFAVVATEVKNLATQTAKATSEIADQIGAVKQATGDAVRAIKSITGVISSIDGSVTAIASAVEEQSAATKEIGRNVASAADGAREVSSFVSRLAGVTRQVRDGAETVSKSSSSLNQRSEVLRGEVNDFLKKVRA